jgi:hypothetical protein
LVVWVELQDAFPNVLHLVFYQISCLSILCAPTVMSLWNISFFCIILWENNVKWEFMVIISYAQLLFITCSSDFNFFCTLSVNTVILRHHCLVCISSVLKWIVSFLP